MTAQQASNTFLALIIATLLAVMRVAPPAALHPGVTAAAGSSRLSLLKEIILPGYIWSVAVTGDKAYAVDMDCESGGGLQVVDLTGEAGPRARGRACGLADGSNIMGIAADGGIVALLPSHSYMPVLVDARDPDHPKRGGSIELSRRLYFGPFMIREGRLVVRQHSAGADPDLVIVFDVSDPMAPRETGRMNLAPSGSEERSSAGLAAHQGVYYLVEGDLRVIKVDAAGVPSAIGSAPIPGRDLERSYVDHLAIDTVAQRLYAVDELHLWVYDIARPDAPKLLAAAVSPPLPEFDNHGLAFKVGDFVVRNNLAFATIKIWPDAEATLIVILDMTDPAAPRQVDVRLPFPFGGMGLDAIGNLIAVGSRDSHPSTRGRLGVFGMVERQELTWRSWLPNLSTASSGAP